MITLITAVPGGGKTALAVDLLLEMAGTRPIYCDGVPGLTIPHEPCPPVPEWTYEAEDTASATGKKISFTFPPNSIVVIDECQRVFRPRSSGTRVPPEVAAFETHRHLGIDFILITQHPSLLDGNIRRLIGKHFHIRVTALGRYRYEWAEIGDPDSRASREVATRTKYRLPKRAFDKYKSAELHTKHKFSIPIAVYILAFGLLSLGAIGWYITKSVSSRLKPESQNVSKLTVQNASDSVSPSHPGTKAATEYLTRDEYLAIHQPRIPGLLHTAPVYDEVTKPQDAPTPVGCIQRPKTGDCRCYDQQGNHYRTTKDVCHTIMNGGIFFEWKKPVEIALKQSSKPPIAEPQSPSIGILPKSDPIKLSDTPPSNQNGNTSLNPRINEAVRS